MSENRNQKLRST